MSPQHHSAGGAEDSSPGRKPGETSVFSDKPRQGRKNETERHGEADFLSPLTGLASITAYEPTAYAVG